MTRTATTSEVAAALGVSPATIQRYAREGRIPFDMTAGGHRRFDVDEVRRSQGAPTVSSAEAAGPRATAVILTALQSEFEAVRAELGEVTVRRLANGTRYHIGSLGGEVIAWTVALAEIGEGNLTAAAETTRAIDSFHPDIVLFVGVAGSLKSDVVHGSVVVANKVYRYQGGKAADDFLSRPLTFPTWHGLEQLVRQVRQSNWSDVEPRPLVAVKPIAAGEVVVASTSSETFRFLHERCNDAVAVDMESAGMYEAAHRAGGLAVLAVRGISDMISDKEPDRDASFQPRASRNAARFAFALLSAADPGDLDLRPAQPPYSNERSELLSSIPPLAAARIEKASAQDELGLMILRMMADTSPPSAILHKIHVELREQLDAAASADLWLAVAEYGAAHRLHGESSIAFERSARVGDESARWFARAALEAAAADDIVRARAMLTAAEAASATSEERRFVAVMAAAVDDDAERIVDAANAHGGGDVLVDVLRVRALAVLGRIDEAANAAMNAVGAHPNHSTAAGLVLEAAELLLYRSEGPGVGRSALQYADQARQLALEVRDLRRQWRGPSAEAATLAARAAAAVRDFGAVVRIACLPPKGEATSGELDHQELTVIAANAAVIAGWTDQARSFAQRVSDLAERRLVEAACARVEGDNDNAILLLKEALRHASDDRQRVRAYISLAEMGEWPLEGLEEFASRDPELAETIRAQADIAAGNLDRATRRLRKIDGEPALSLLVTAYADAGRIDDAVAALVTAAERLGKPHYRLRAASVLASVGRFRDALDIASTALAQVPGETHLHSELRQLCMRLTGRLQQWADMVEHARAAVAEGDDSDETAWLLVGGLFNVRSVDAARQEMISAGLKPRDEEEALLAIQLLRTGDPTSAAVAAVLDVADSYLDSEMVTAGAFMAVLEMSRDIDLPEEVASRIQPMSETFFERWPESKIVTRIDVSNIDNLVQYMREHFGRGVDELLELVSKAVLGQLPYGLAAAVRGRTLSSLLTTRGLGCIPLGTVDATQREAEMSAAWAALDREIAVDTNALHTVGHIGCSPVELMSRFSRTLVARQTLDDAIAGADSLALRSTATMGWDQKADRPFLIEIGESQAEAWAQESAEVAARARTCVVREVVVRDSDRADAKLEVVLAPVELARRERCSLWSDDPALRQVAHSEGVPVFDTLALLEVLKLRQEMSSEAVRRAHLEMMRAFLVDLPFDGALVLQLAEDEGWIGGAAAYPLTRPTSWADAEQVIEVYRVCVAECQRRVPEALSTWSYAACLGAARAILPQLRLNALATLVLSGFLHAGGDPASLPLLLRGARAAAEETGLDDPLPAVAQLLRSALSGEGGEELTPQLFAHTVGRLDDADRLIALEELLRPGPSSRP